MTKRENALEGLKVTVTYVLAAQTFQRDADLALGGEV
jgi:hypothetical protein